jgi:hypothetical protein
MAAAGRLAVAVSCAVLLVHAARAQEPRAELTPAGKAMLQDILARDGRPLYDRAGPTKPAAFPAVMCAFHGGLCGAVRRDGTIAVPPRFDWIGAFADGRAAVRLGGLYGFVDEDGREIVTPQYRIVGDYKHGFAQVDVDGKSGLIDRDGKMVLEPKYGFIEAIAPDRFRVAEKRLTGISPGISREFFPIIPDSAPRPAPVSQRISGLIWPGPEGGVIDISGKWIEPPRRGHAFDKDDPSIRWVEQDKLWGLQRTDGTWLIEPRFQQRGPLSSGLAPVALNGKWGFIDRTGKFAIEPTLDKAWGFSGLDRTAATRDGIVGVIDRSGAWIFKTDYQQIHLAVVFSSKVGETQPAVGWHFKKAGRWGLLDLDGRVVLDADFDQSVSICADGRRIAYKSGQALNFKADGSPLDPPNGRLLIGSCMVRPPYQLKIGDKVGLVAADWTTPLTPVHFDALTPAGGPSADGSSLWNAKLASKWGRNALDGRWVVGPKFDYLSTERDLFVAAVGGKRGIMRADGTWLIEPRFDAARLRDAETAFVTVAGATGLLRLKDESWVIPPRPGVMCDIHGGVLSKSDRRRAIFSRTGEIWIDMEADLIGLSLDLGLLVFRRDGKWGLVDTAGKVTLEPTYDDLSHFLHRGVAWAKLGDRRCAIDRRGQAVPGIACEPPPTSRPADCFRAL